MNHSRGTRACAITMWKMPKATAHVYRMTLLHEAVHIWQEIQSHIGESAPSVEFEAYAIETIANNLTIEWEARMKKKNIFSFTP